jgi:hypothetical protein
MKKNNHQLTEICRFPVAGVQYSDYQCVLGLKAGRKVTFTWERSNKYDDNAIRIDIDGVKIGYVPRGEHQDTLHELREERTKIVSSISAYNKTNPTWAMLHVKVETKEKYTPREERIDWVGRQDIY